MKRKCKRNRYLSGLKVFLWNLYRLYYVLQIKSSLYTEKNRADRNLTNDQGWHTNSKHIKIMYPWCEALRKAQHLCKNLPQDAHPQPHHDGTSGKLKFSIPIEFLSSQELRLGKTRKDRDTDSWNQPWDPWLDPGAENDVSRRSNLTDKIHIGHAPLCIS